MKEVTKIFISLFKTILAIVGIIAAVVVIIILLDMTEHIWLITKLRNTMCLFLT